MTTNLIDLNHLLGLAEIATEYGISYSTALSWTRSRGFPAPAKSFSMGACWLKPDIDEWRIKPNRRRFK